jgi:DNA-binding NarL/FixJ family response regulator
MVSGLKRKSRNGLGTVQTPEMLQKSRGASVAEKRRMIAEFCRTLGMQIGVVKPAANQNPEITERMKQTLQHLLAGDSEKQVAAKLGLSRNTVHVYVKNLYKYFHVYSRGELLAKCLRPPGKASAANDNPTR